MGYPGYAGWQVILDPPELGGGRTPLDINSPDSGISIGGTDGGAGPDWGTAQLSQFMAMQGKWGSAPASFIAPNRTITIPLGIGMAMNGVDPETALRNLSMKVALIAQEGGTLKRQRAGGAPLFADIVDATLDVPDDWLETGGIEPGVTLVLTTLPDFYGAEVTLDAIHCTGFCTGLLTLGGQAAVIPGDYPARCRLQVTDTSNHKQYAALWGLRSKYYSSLATAQLAYHASSDLLPLFGTSNVTLTGSYSPLVVRSATLSSAGTWSEMVALGYQPTATPLTHTGTYNVWVRAYGSTSNLQLQLQWANGYQTFLNWTPNTPAIVPNGNFAVLNLGLVSLQAPPVGSQQWSGALFAMSPAGGGTVSVDMVWLQPVDAAGTSQAAPFTNGSAASTPIVYLNATTEFRSDGVWGAGLGGPGFYSTIPTIGDLPRLPPSGMEKQPVQLLMKLSRNEFSVADLGIDTFTVTPVYRPCYLTRI
jgi:hypothetical protein